MKPSPGQRKFKASSVPYCDNVLNQVDIYARGQRSVGILFQNEKKLSDNSAEWGWGLVAALFQNGMAEELSGESTA
jgi:hypothetical protein